MSKKIINHLVVGIAIGFIVTTVCLWIYRVYEAPGIVVMRHFTVWLIASAFYGLISIIYDTNISFPKSLVIHFLGCVSVTFIASFASGLLEIMKLYQWFIYVLPSFVIIYLIIGAAVTGVTHIQTKKINDKIKKSRV